MVADEIAQIENQRKRNDMRNKTSSCIKEEWHDEVLEIADDGAQNGTKTLRHLQSHTSSRNFLLDEGPSPSTQPS